MQPFDRVVLIFNPNSTGNASGLAAELCDDLARRQPDLPVMLQQTEHAGHARDLARDAALTGCPLLVSVSGTVATTRSKTNFLDLTNSPTGHRPCASSKTTARPATPTTSPSKKQSAKTAAPSSFHSWHSYLDASTCGARSPASWTWV